MFIYIVYAIDSTSCIYTMFFNKQRKFVITFIKLSFKILCTILLLNINIDNRKNIYKLYNRYIDILYSKEFIYVLYLYILPNLHIQTYIHFEKQCAVI